jgi:hypothetical protein
MNQAKLLGGYLGAVIALAASSASFADPVQTPGQNYTPPAHESCCNGKAPPLTPTQVSQLEADINSKAILSQDQYKIGGGQLTANIRDLLLSDSGALDGILALLSAPNINSDQKAAIAAGLAQAARLWLGGDPALSTYIQQRVAATNDGAFILAYSTAAGNQPIGSTGGAGSAGGPGGQTSSLGGPGSGTGNVEGIGNAGTNTSGFSMTGGVVGSSSNSTSP